MADEVWLSERIEDLLLGDVRGCVDEHDVARRLLSSLALDPLLRVVRTLGIVPDGSGAAIVPGKITRLLTSDEAAEVVMRAFSRLRLMLSKQRLTSGDVPMPVGEARSLCDEPLGGQSEVLHAVLSRIARVEHQVRLTQPVPCQLSLFSEAT
ncbi:hypothetical protein [Castellaniella sp.]|uniref:hypothetical protein n=1 Tax=Castellaniella sp. TaxID=1955812 RepID=UPI003A93E0E1